MIFKINRDELFKVLNTLQPFLDKRDVSGKYSSFLFSINNNICNILATDKEIGLEISINGIKSDINGSFLVSGKKLIDSINNLTNEDINFELIDEILFVKQKYSRFKIPIIPELTQEKVSKLKTDSKITMKSDILMDSFKKIRSSVSSTSSKMEICGILIDIKEEDIKIVGTDTLRLSIIDIKCNNKNELQMIIPKKAIIQIQKIFTENKNIDIFFDDNNLAIYDQNRYFFSKLINGTYPNYERIIPKELKYNLEIPVQEFISIIKSISLINNIISINFQDNKITFDTVSGDNTEAHNEIKINLNLESNILIKVNSRFILDVLSNISEEKAIFNIQESNLPFTIESKNYMTIIMPITVD